MLKKRMFGGEGMGFFDNIGKTISDASQGAIQKGKEMADVAKYNSLISDEEKKASSIYEQLGRKYVEVKGDSPDDIFKEYVDALNVSNGKVKEYQEKLVELKGVSKCPSCGAEVPNGSMFCAVCGTKITVESKQVEMDVKKCSACGAVIPNGSKFCTSCGKAAEENTNNEQGEEK